MLRKGASQEIKRLVPLSESGHRVGELSDHQRRVRGEIVCETSPVFRGFFDGTCGKRNFPGQVVHPRRHVRVGEHFGNESRGLIEALRTQGDFNAFAIEMGRLQAVVFARLRLDGAHGVDCAFPLVFDRVDRQQSAQRSEVFARYFGQFSVFGFGPVEKTRGEVVLGKLGKRLRAVRIREVRTIDEMKMQTNRAFEFAPAAEELAEHVMELDQIGIESAYLDENVDRLVGFVVQQERHTPGEVFRQLGLLAALAAIEPATQPPGRKERGQRDEIPEVKFHFGSQTKRDVGVSGVPSERPNGSKP